MPLVEFSYDMTVHPSISMALYEALMVRGAGLLFDGLK